jgi:hypothetical protein
MLAQRAGRDPSELYALTAGNPFYVTELLATADDGGVPASVRDAVALRIAGISPAARAAVELAAVVPGATELWLLAETVAADAAAIDECIEGGCSRCAARRSRFRHDPRPPRVEDAISPARRREARPASSCLALELNELSDPARLAHTRARGRRGAIRRLAPAAARAAERGGRPSAGVRALGGGARGRGGRRPARRERALEGVAVEGLPLRPGQEALEARRALLAIHEAARDRRAAPRRPALALALCCGGRPRRTRRTAFGDRAIAALEAFPDSRELAMALSGALAARDARRAPRRGGRARQPRVERSRAGSTTARPSPTR